MMMLILATTLIISCDVHFRPVLYVKRGEGQTLGWKEVERHVRTSVLYFSWLNDSLRWVARVRGLVHGELGRKHGELWLPQGTSWLLGILVGSSC